MSEPAPRYRARVYPTDQEPLRVDRLHPRRSPASGNSPTPGNVGVCLSGGGSRALSAGMGQLRALAHLEANGRSLLSQVKALSVVSGGAWLSVPFTYLPPEVSDEAFLGRYVADPALLVRSWEELEADQEADLARVLSELPEGSAATAITDPSFEPTRLALEALFLYAYHEVPTSMLWQTLMGLHLLRPFGLYEGGAEQGFWPEIPFTRNARSRAELIKDNPEAAEEELFLYADAHPEAGTSGPPRVARPFLICNLAMLLKEEGGFRRAVPVQSTPIFTGVVGRPEGVDVMGRPVGGGGISSFAFLSRPVSLRGESATVEIDRAWTLTDALGVSSAAFAEQLENTFVGARDIPDQAQALSDRIEGALDGVIGDWVPDSLELEDLISNETLVEMLGELAEIVPGYHCWNGAGEDPKAEPLMNSFIDGGSLENTGILAMLSYADIDRVMAFVNAKTPLGVTERGVLDEAGREIPESRILIDPQVPPLFGYQPYREGVGYRLYAGDPEPLFPVFARSQVFERGEFPRLLRALAAAREAGGPTFAQMRLRVLTNRWFGVRGRGGPGDPNPEPIVLLFSYMERAREWHSRLRPEVLELLGEFEDRGSFFGFPCYETEEIRLSPERVNLLAHLAAWCVAGGPHRERFLALFEEG